MAALQTPVVSVVSPVYRASAVIETFVTRVSEELRRWNVSFEIVLVDDRSPDDSWQRIRVMSRTHPQVRAFRLSKNFGQHNAVTAGLANARGEWVFVMDCDLQDDPADLRLLYDKAIRDNLDIVFTKRQEREQPLLKKIAAWGYGLLFGVAGDARYGVVYGSLVLFNDKVKRSFLMLKETDRLYLQILRWLGYDNGFVEVQHHKRYAGKSSYTFGRMMQVAVRGWVSFSNRLLYYAVMLGFALAVMAVLGALYIVYQYFNHGYQTGWASLFVAIIFSTGIVLISIGVTGIYIGKIFNQVKERPLYIVDESISSDDGMA
jgi:dolichol-phosphate mannosyltransferase